MIDSNFLLLEFVFLTSPLWSGKYSIFASKPKLFSMIFMKCIRFTGFDPPMLKISFFSNFVDLFSGAGGISLGFKNAGFESVLSADNDKSVELTHKFNFPEHKFISDDLSLEQTKDNIIRTYY